MEQTRSEQMYYHWISATAQFDYFVSGVSLAITGYLAARLEPVRVALTPAGLEILAVLLMLGCSVASLKRVEAIVTLTGAMHRRLHQEEVAGGLKKAATGGSMVRNEATGDVFSAAQALELAFAAKAGAKATAADTAKWADRAWSWYRWRNRLLYSGLVAYALSQILAAYWMP